MNVIDDAISHYNIGVISLNKIAIFYNEILLSNEEILQYCFNRGITIEDIREFRIGYADKSNLLQDLIEKESINILILEEAGILIKDTNNYYMNFYKRLMFPIFDLCSNVSGFSGRVLEKISKRKYINSHLSFLYQKSLVLYGLYQAYPHIQQQNTVLIVEGNTDVITCHRYGIKIAVCANGTSFMEDHFLLLKQFTNRFIFCWDNDTGGKRAKNRMLELTKNMSDIKVGFLDLQNLENLDGPKDPDEFLRKFGVDSFLISLNKIKQSL